jgi:ribosomal-protein-alanine N-acetyltransferase
MQLKTERLLIRPFSPEDFDGFYALVSHKEVMKYLPENVMSKDEAKEIFDWLIGCYTKNKPEKILKYTVGIIEKPTKKLIGWCGFGPLDFDSSKIEVYYGLSRDYWGKGFATEASKSIVKYAFGTVGLNEMFGVVIPENIGSIKVLEKIGMKYQKHISGISGEYSHYNGSLLYALKKEDFDMNN